MVALLQEGRRLLSPRSRDLFKGSQGNHLTIMRGCYGGRMAEPEDTVQNPWLTTIRTNFKFYMNNITYSLQLQPKSLKR